MKFTIAVSCLHSGTHKEFDTENLSEEGIKDMILFLTNEIQQVKNQEEYNAEPKTMEDIIKKIRLHDPNSRAFYIPTCARYISSSHDVGILVFGGALPTINLAKQIQALSKLMTVAYVLNGFKHITLDGEWRRYYIDCTLAVQNCEIKIGTGFSVRTTISPVYFKDEEAAKKAIKILGESTIKHAFGIFD